ncbi:MAG: FAD-dependent oxidoreductase [Bacteroidota bacterium]|nr:FAD-dependent oxidoreductase [Bacteroidota bacterium]
MNAENFESLSGNESVIIVGGGITGLCTAYYLQKKGIHSAIIDSGNITDGCSFGNMGYLSPSHFIPLASPGVISEGLKHIFSNKSPFYIKPRLNVKFLQWGLQFYKNSTQAIVDKNAPHLNDLLQLSRRLMNEIRDDIGDVFDMQEIGCMMMCRSRQTYQHELQVAANAEKLGLKVVRLNAAQVQEMEPAVEVKVAGAVLFKDDAHIDPGKFMQAMKNYLEKNGTTFLLNTTVNGFIKKGNEVTGIITNKGEYNSNNIVLSAGSWLPEVAKMLGIKLLLEPGKGYSYTYDYVEKNIRYPAILVDARCAITPWKHKLRIGGTMEFSGINNKVLINRMQGIYNSVQSFYPGLKIDFPPKDKVWTGLRPVTPDGLPYIGRNKDYKNLVIAGGHAMLGVSEAAGTGKIVTDLIAGANTEIDISAFYPGRF